MFERYTEKARRVIFFARYEASEFGSPYIETEHILLGLLREDKAFTTGHLTPAQIADIRRDIEANTTIREKIPTSADLPLSDECKRILGYAAEEMELANHEVIGTWHPAAAILREEGCYAAKLLRTHGVELKTIREELRSGAHQPQGTGPRGRWVQGAPAQTPFQNVEFFHGGEKLASAVLSVLPRAGEFVLLKQEGSDKRYRVLEVSYELLQPPIPGYPLVLHSITVSVEPA